MKPLSGMDASFLYMETPSQLAQRRGRARPRPDRGRGLLVRARASTSSGPACICSRRSGDGSCPSRSTSDTRCGSRTPTSTSKPTSIAARSGRRARCASWPRWWPTSRRCRSTAAVRCGSCTSSKVSSTARSGSSPRSTTPTIDGVTGTDLLANLFDLDTRRAGPGAARRTMATGAGAVRSRARRVRDAAHRPAAAHDGQGRSATRVRSAGRHRATTTRRDRGRSPVAGAAVHRAEGAVVRARSRRTAPSRSARRRSTTCATSRRRSAPP